MSSISVLVDALEAERPVLEHVGTWSAAEAALS